MNCVQGSIEKNTAEITECTAQFRALRISYINCRVNHHLAKAKFIEEQLKSTGKQSAKYQDKSSKIGAVYLLAVTRAKGSPNTVLRRREFYVAITTYGRYRQLRLP